MKKKHKFTRPDNPFTDKVLDDIEAKANKVMAKFKVLANEEKRQSRRHEIIGRLKTVVMKAYQKFRPNDNCSFSSFADRFLVLEVRHCLRHYAYIVAKENATVSCDRKLDGNDEEAPSFVDSFADPRDRFSEGLLTFDFDIVTKLLKKQNPVYATVFELRREGYSLAEIYPMLGIPKWELYDIVWPAVKNAVRRIYDYGC